MQEYRITKALPEDKESLLLIKKQAHAYFVQTLPHLYQLSDILFTEDFINCYFDNLNHIALLAKVNNQTVGYALVDKVAVDLPMMRNRIYVYIQDIAVREDFRNLGIATDLLHMIEEIAKEWNADSLELAVHSNNQNAVHLYQRYGFAIRTYRMEKNISNLTVIKSSERTDSLETGGFH
jgi:ribosomal protein S18 acetylase RimI-like enzyme